MSYLEIKIDLPTMYYRSETIDEVIDIDESLYDLIYVDSVIVSMHHVPSAIDAGQIMIFINVVIDTIESDPYLSGIFAAASWDLIKFFKDKMKIIHSNLRDKRMKKIPIDMSFNIKSVQEGEKIELTILTNSDDLDQVLSDIAKISRISEIVKGTGTISCYYDDGDWILRNEENGE